jgi:tRNA(adenine34) deaminase
MSALFHPSFAQSQSVDEQWMSAALALARRAEFEGEVPVAAIVVRGEEIVGRGWNRNIGLNDPTAHAEVEALREAGRILRSPRLLGCSLYVTLEPCLMCAGALVHARVDRLVFGALDPKAGAVSSVFDVVESAKHNHSVRVTGGVLGVESSILLQQFFKRRRQN